MPIGNRVLLLMKDVFRLSRTKFAESIGVPPTTLKSLRAEQEGITSTVITAILQKHPSINYKWLLWGEGDMFLANDPKKIINGDNGTVNIQSNNSGDSVIKQGDNRDLGSDYTVFMKEIKYLKKENEMLKKAIEDKELIINLLQKK